MRKSGTTKMIPCMTEYKRGDVVLVPFPFSHQAAVKQRPAVILSIEDYNRGDDLIIAGITSKFVSSGKWDCPISRWKEAGLLKRSAVKAMITTVEKSLIRKKLGEIQGEDMRKIDKCLSKVMGFVSI